MMLGISFSIYYGDDDILALLGAGLLTSITGITIWFFTRKTDKLDLGKREGYLIVTLGWVCMSLFGALPFIFHRSIPNFSNAFFETMSGFTTTGASILTNIESMPHGLLFWRSFTQWIGGMGIIVLSLAILPLLGIGGMQLYAAEVPGITKDKLHPRVKETAKRLWIIYLGFTVAEAVLLMFAGMNFAIHYLIIHRKFSFFKNNDEFRYYLFLILGVSIFIAIIHQPHVEFNLEEAFRHALFHVVSLVTTTGFVSSDYENWAVFSRMIFFILLFIGGSAGSTGGGIKVVRHLLLFKNGYLELKRLIHPRSIIPVRLNGKAVSSEIISNVQAFFIIYILIFVLGSILLSLMGVDFISSVGAVATCLGNVGPGIGTVGPVANFNHLPEMAKWLLSFLMLLGRLELFTVLIIFTPYFWKK